MGHLKGFSPECNFMWRSKFPFWVKEAPHWLHWNGLSPEHTGIDGVTVLAVWFGVDAGGRAHLCGYACAPSAHWVQCRSSHTPHTGAFRWAGGWVLARQRLDWSSRCKHSPGLFRRRGTRRSCPLPAPLYHPSCWYPLTSLCSPAGGHKVTHPHCTAQP